jgi:hypothetical protein
MAITTYVYPPILVDISDAVIGATVVKRRARRVDVRLPDNPTSPCVLEVEVIPYAQLAGGGYGDELVGGVFKRDPKFIRVSHHRLVDEVTGRILASRFGADGSLRPDADWQADVDRLSADADVQAMYQDEWFGKLLRTTPAVVDDFIVQYIQLADASGDLG